ncbi:jg4131 [Pararge aegeria aegeria]|uniref:Jg4131 protein n=1 Tax=Pararge aegeria aegeria TaxID=348720 RepID=A0A8S4QWZ2_9NEOP|nr:jg4131 [Pararge aegeria aegeria]
MDKWRITASPAALHITFTLRTGDCPPVKLGNDELAHTRCVRYLGLHLDRKLTWKNRIQTKRVELNLKYRGLYWLLARNSKLSTQTTPNIQNSTKTHMDLRITLWGFGCDSNIKINPKS